MALTALLTLLVAAYVAGFVLGWGGANARAKLTYALYLPLTSGPMVLAWRVAGRRSLPLATRRAWRRLGVGFDVVYLAGAGVMLVGLLAFPAGGAAARSRCAWPSTSASAWRPRSWWCGTWCSGRPPRWRTPTG